MFLCVNKSHIVLRKSSHKAWISFSTWEVVPEQEIMIMDFNGGHFLSNVKRDGLTH